MFIHSDKMIISADIGGTHITTAVVHPTTLEVETHSIQRMEIDGKSTDADTLLNSFLDSLNNALSAVGDRGLAGISIAMPGPFDYTNGIFQLRELDKFNALFGLNFKAFLYSHLPITAETPIIFNNDADCFGLGAYQLHLGSEMGKIIAITLGTGFGTSFVKDSAIIHDDPSVPPEGNLFNQPLIMDQDDPALQFEYTEDIISSRGILNYVNSKAERQFQDLAEMAQLAAQKNNPVYQDAFDIFGRALASCLAPWCDSFGPDRLVIGGGIMKAADLFMPSLLETLQSKNTRTPAIDQAKETERTTIVGAAYALQQTLHTRKTPDSNQPWRKTHQELLPKQINIDDNYSGVYGIYPYTSIGADKIHPGFDGIAKWMQHKAIVAIDGYIGNDWALLQQKISASLNHMDIQPLWIDMAAFLKTEQQIESLVAPYLGDERSVWGKKTDLQLTDFYDPTLLTESLSAARLKVLASFSDLVIVFGIGSGMIAGAAPVIYVDLPKNEVQYRMRAGTALNLGAKKLHEYSTMYKRSYFVDWPVLNNRRAAIADKIAIVADGQWRDEINWMTYTDLCSGFDKMCTEPIRARPWFAPGAWGGDWMKKHIPQLSDAEVNYAWSFELIVPENGLILESSGYLLEVPFEWLMDYAAKKVIGADADTFGTYFPIRFDFLDTFHGGNLSIQCHPSLPYIQEQFGETITQDETYYMLDCAPGAGVYLGFQEDIVPTHFQQALESSQRENRPIAIEKYVQLLPAKKHDLFLIPNQTVHSAGVNNLVLEISATPYIFTFKMYDWLRPDLNGRPRPINIEHAFNNLDFSRKGARVQEELCSKPQVLESAAGFERVHLPTHAVHFYDIHRLDLSGSCTEVTEVTDGKCHILMVVEGQGVSIVIPDRTQNQPEAKFDFAFAETFVIPASVKEYRVVNQSGSAIKIIKAFIK